MESKPLAIIYSDLHLNIWPKFNEGNQRLHNGLDVIERITKKAQELRIPKIFLGDIIHKEESVSNELLSDLLPQLKKYFGTKYGEKTLAISGNHDQSTNNFFDDESTSYIKTLSNTFENFECIDFTGFKLGDYHFHGVPYITNDIGLIDYIKGLGRDYKSKKNVLLLHTTLPTARDTDNREIHSNLEKNKFLKATKRFDLVLSGHIHKPEEIIKKYMYSIGAPQQQRATDRDCDMGYWILYEDLKMEFVHLDHYPIFKYYTKKPKDDGNFWIKKPKKKKRKVSISLDIKGDISSSKIHRVARKYCKSKNIKDKTKILALRKTLKDAI